MDRAEDERAIDVANGGPSHDDAAIAPRARSVGVCWICRAAVRDREATIAPTVCARCYDSLHSHWR